MTIGVSNALNLALMRMSYIEQDFQKLESIVPNSVSKSNPEKDFQQVLNNKTEENNSITDEIKENKIKLGEIPEEINEEKKEKIDLKSKIDLMSQTTNIDEIIETFSDKYDVDSDFIKAIIKQESGFKPNVTSKKGAMGLMQLMPQTAKSLGVIDAYNPSQNVEGGVKYLKGLLDRFDNDKKLALAAYNAGPTAVKRYGGIPPYKETQNYVNSIMSMYDKIKGAEL